MNSLRLEKSFGIWNCEFTQGYTAGMTGMDRWIAWNKGESKGRGAALAEREKNTAPQRLVTREVDALDADASGYEPVWKAGRRVGFVTSGGYGHHVGKSLATALVDVEHAQVGEELHTMWSALSAGRASSRAARTTRAGRCGGSGNVDRSAGSHDSNRRLPGTSHRHSRRDGASRSRAIRLPNRHAITFPSNFEKSDQDAA